MKQNNFLKKALTFISAAVMAGAVGLGAGVGSMVSADGDTSADGTSTAGTPSSATTDVVLTKYAVSDGKVQPQTSFEPKSDAEQANHAVVNGAKFDVYNVTDQYWDHFTYNTSEELNATKGADSLENNLFDVTGLTPISGETGKPDKNGNTISGAYTFTDLPNYNDKGQYSVYLFRETYAPKGYNYSPDFVISLPAKAGENADGATLKTAYVYPKDQINGKYQLKFTKVDANNNQTPLQGAEFYIKNGNKYASVTGYEGGFDDKAPSVEWLESTGNDEDGNPIVPEGATLFTSDAQGLFGFTAETQTTKNGKTFGLDPDTDYTIEEKTAPKGYNTDAKIDGKDAAGVKVNPTDTDTNTVVEDTPKGILPHTGGAGIIAIVAAGLAITVIGVAAYSKRRANA